MRIVRRKARYRGDAQDPGGLVRCAAVKIVLGQPADQPVAAEEQRQRLNDGRLAAVVRADQNGMTTQRNVRRPYPTETADFQTDDVHGGLPPIS